MSESELNAGGEVIERRRLLRSVAQLFGGAAVGQIVAIAISPILTRLFTPSDFGVAGAYGSIVGIMFVVSCLRFEYAIAIQKNNRDATDVVRLCLFVLAISTSLVVIASFVMKDWLLQELFPGEEEWFVVLIPVGFFSASIYNLLTFHAVRDKQYSLIARTRVVQGLSSSAIQLGTGLLGWGAVGLVSGRIAGLSGGVGTLARALRKRWESKGRRGVRGLAILASKNRKFALFSAPGAMLNNFARQAPLLFMALIFDPVIAGFYALADRVLRLPIGLLGKATSQVFLGEASELLNRGERKGLSVLFRKSSAMMFAIAIIPAVILAISAPSIFEFVFGKNWIVAGKFVRLLTPLLLVRFVVTPFIQALLILGKQGLQFAWELLNASLILAVFLVSWQGSISPEQTILYFSMAGVLSYTIVALIVRHAISQELSQ